jgi:hypothetical protein
MKKRNPLLLLLGVCVLAGLAYTLKAASDWWMISQRKGFVMNEGVTIARHSEMLMSDTQLSFVTSQGIEVVGDRWMKADPPYTPHSDSVIFWYDEPIDGKILAVRQDKSVQWSTQGVSLPLTKPVERRFARRFSPIHSPPPPQEPA